MDMLLPVLNMITKIDREPVVPITSIPALYKMKEEFKNFEKNRLEKILESVQLRISNLD